MRPSNAEITRHHDQRPDANPYVGQPPPPRAIRIVDYDPEWPAQYQRLAAIVRGALGATVLQLHHVGSTSVPGLPAKPIIDADLIVADPAAEAGYVPALVAAGFVHTVREPWWHEHRLLTRPDPPSNLHVFGPDSPELIRNLMFRDWLRAHPDDLARYAAAKRASVVATTDASGAGLVADYNHHKEPVIRAIYQRMFRANGLLD